MWRADAFLESMYNEAVEKTKNSQADMSAEERKRYLKQALRRLIGEFETNENHKPVLLEQESCDGYIRERIELSAVPGLSFASYILIPEDQGKPMPAAVAVHGHGYGSREIVGLRQDGSSDPEPPGIHQHFAVQLVRRGMVVIAPDVAGFGERRLAADLARNPEAANSCHRLSTQLLMHGKTLAGLRVAETLRALDYLAERPEVQPDRIGIMGFSGGGLISFLCAALDERIRAAVLAGYPNTFKDSIMAVQHCICNYIPGMLSHAELPEWIGLISPRPLYLESGTDDRIFPAAGFNLAVEQLRDTYRRAGAEERLRTDLFPGAHEISGLNSYDWLCSELERVAHA
ncbi:MAG: alpha/beta hydrolase family protein [Paenibacillus lautus]|jgi:dienelactone hydrolase|uniref:dienelactone hydrolase family protein n=1 Tax=Paenibacillus lautus TaxID=1401 RepID=UPI0026F2DFC7|nr:alpha/beta hydrolase family protein [Paenibacillus lautus]MCI1773800.1 alpha/beta hydrolase family protein [Paenibacillus lautus]